LDTLVLTPATGESWRLPAGRPLAFSPDGTMLLVGRGPSVELWRLDDRSVRPATGDGVTAEILAAAFTPDGRSFATVGWDGSIVIWDTGAAPSVRPVAGFAAP